MITNLAKIPMSPLRKVAISMIEAGLASVETRAVIRAQIRIEGSVLCAAAERIDLSSVERLLFVGIGKCAFDAAAAIEPILADRLTGGIAIGVTPAPALSRIRTIQGTHPLPSPQNVEATRRLLSLLTGLTPRDLVIFVVSGGGSTLLSFPDARSCDEERAVVQLLMQRGATIHEINTVRKHLSLARGGNLSRAAYPARVLSLIFSDVPGNDLDVIASGPTVLDTSTIEDAAEVLARHDVLNLCNLDDCGLLETPKDPRFFESVSNVLLVSNKTALEAMGYVAREHGFSVTLCDTCLVGEAQHVGPSILHSLRNHPSKTALLYGGETTVTAHGTSGHGGRNLELALSGLASVEDGELLISLASDGMDNGPFAGAICDTITAQTARDMDLSIATHLANHDSYPFFEKAGHYLVTGSTGINVSDLIIALKS